MTNYYYLTSTFPALEVGVAPETTLSELDHLLTENLKPADMHQVHQIRRYWDILNLRSLWNGEELDPAGNFAEKELEEALLTELLPYYVTAYESQYTELADKLSHFPSLVTQFFREEIQHAKGFVRDYLSFEREWRLVMLGFRSKKQGRNLAHELRYEDPMDDVVAQLMAQKDSKVYEPPFGYEDLKHIFETRQDNPLALHKALSEYRFQKVSEMVEGAVFSLDRVLSFLVQLIIVEKWEHLNKAQGQVIVEAIVKESK